jgi:hypothetical protein
MTDPDRLISTADDFERDLLASASVDRGSDRALKRTLIAIGTGTAIGIGTAGSASATSATILLKWVGIGAAVGLVTAGGATWVAHEPSTAPGSSPTFVAQENTEATPAAIGEDFRSSPPESTQLSPQPPPFQAPRSPIPPAPGVEASPQMAAAPSVGELPTLAPRSELLLREVRILDRAKLALQGGNAAGALAALDEHARSFPGGVLRPESDVLRVKALIAAGNRAAAIATAKRLIASQPSGPHARAVTALLPELAPPSSNP